MRLRTQHVGRAPAPTWVVEKCTGERDHVRGSCSQDLLRLTRIRDEADGASDCAGSLADLVSEWNLIARPRRYCHLRANAAARHADVDDADLSCCFDVGDRLVDVPASLDPIR